MLENADKAHLDLEDLAKRREEVYFTEQYQKLMTEAQKEVKEIEPHEVDLEDPTNLLLDVREPDEFASGYIRKENHLTIPRGRLEFVAIKKIFREYGADVRIITYCFKGPRGLLSAYQLKKLGFTNVVNLRDGLKNWLGQGRTLRSYFGEIALVNI
jgi:rhodanese-related sulfurtransferase